MHDLYQVLRQKEMDLERVRNEIEALKFVIPLLREEADRTERVSPVSAVQSRRSGPRGD
jgi:hypothetical protein